MRSARRSPWPWLGAAALVIAGVASGALHDEAPSRPEVVRAGYRVLASDFHVHTMLSDGGLSPLVVPWHARKHGLDVIAVTEHNGLLAARLARAVAHATGPARAPIVLLGEEITTRDAHMIGVGLETTVAPTRDPADAVRAVHAQGGVVFAAHPVERYWPKLTPVRAMLDGSEVAHPFANPAARAARATSRVGGWRAADLETFFEGAQAKDAHPLAAIASSDYHWGAGLGRVRTWLFVDGEPSEARVLDAIRARRTVVRSADGDLVGDPALVRALVAEPLPPSLEAPPEGYRAKGTGDAVLRVLGLAGVLGVVFLRRR
jgi:hypothetical protein